MCVPHLTFAASDNAIKHKSKLNFRLSPLSCAPYFNYEDQLNYIPSRYV
jgi:hypothetical protein